MKTRILPLLFALCALTTSARAQTIVRLDDNDYWTAGFFTSNNKNVLLTALQGSSPQFTDLTLTGSTGVTVADGGKLYRSADSFVQLGNTYVRLDFPSGGAFTVREAGTTRGTWNSSGLTIGDSKRFAFGAGDTYIDGTSASDYVRVVAADTEVARFSLSGLSATEAVFAISATNAELRVTKTGANAGSGSIYNDGTMQIVSNAATDVNAYRAGTHVFYNRSTAATYGSWNSNGISVGSPNVTGGVVRLAGEVGTIVTPTYSKISAMDYTDAVEKSYIRFANRDSNTARTTVDIGVRSTANTVVTGLSVDGDAGVALLGTATNDNAATGYVGEYVSSAVEGGSAISLTTGNAANVTSIALSAGDWDVTANVFFAGGATTGTEFIGNISATSATLSLTAANYATTPTAPTAAANVSIAVPAFRISLAGAATYYLVVRGTFSAGSPTAFGTIHARRVR